MLSEKKSNPTEIFPSLSCELSTITVWRVAHWGLNAVKPTTRIYETYWKPRAKPCVTSPAFGPVKCRPRILWSAARSHITWGGRKLTLNQGAEASSVTFLGSFLSVCIIESTPHAATELHPPAAGGCAAPVMHKQCISHKHIQRFNLHGIIMWHALSKSGSFKDKHGFISTFRFWVILMFCLTLNKQSLGFQNLKLPNSDNIWNVKLVKAWWQDSSKHSLQTLLYVFLKITTQWQSVCKERFRIFSLKGQ